MTTESWLGSEELKAKITAQVLAHQEADEIIQGKYWEDGKGCAVGCILHDSQHGRFESEFGIPEWGINDLNQHLEQHRAQEAREAEGADFEQASNYWGG